MSERKRKFVGEKAGKFTKCHVKSIKKRHRPQNRFEMEQESASTSTLAKKFNAGNKIDNEVNANFGYRVINFLTVFSAISSVVKCKKCDGDITFAESSIRGLGFTLVIKCDSCKPTSVHSSPLINGKAYEINRRIIFVSRLLGFGHAGIEKFCGLMDLPRPVFRSMYNKILNNIHHAAETVCNLSMKNAIEEEKRINEEKENGPGLTISGDGTWQKRGFSSLFGVSTLIGHYSGKVIDLVVKSAYCKSCESWKKLSITPEYNIWKETHEKKCSANHEGSSGKMEVDAIREMFARYQEKYSVMYTNYIGDGDSKTYKGVVDFKPYGDEVICKKECIGHVQKRMGTRLRSIKKVSKGLGGKGKLTDKLINELTVYYGLAIRRNSHCKEAMKKAIWSTFLHKISSDKNPQHQMCPPGTHSWCSWQVAKATNTLKNYVHKNPLSQIVQDTIRPIYEDLSTDKLLLLVMFSRRTTVDIAAFTAASIFNDGYNSILIMMQLLNLTTGSISLNYCRQTDERRLSKAATKVEENSKRARKLLRETQKEKADSFCEAEGTLYGPGIAD
ncbi:hypothetical protein ANTRET_LOCUS2273, partial [Anthophora retusa]